MLDRAFGFQIVTFHMEYLENMHLLGDVFAERSVAALISQANENTAREN